MPDRSDIDQLAGSGQAASNAVSGVGRMLQRFGGWLGREGLIAFG